MTFSFIFVNSGHGNIDILNIGYDKGHILTFDRDFCVFKINNTIKTFPLCKIPSHIKEYYDCPI